MELHAPNANGFLLRKELDSVVHRHFTRKYGACDHSAESLNGEDTVDGQAEYAFVLSGLH